MVKQITGKPSKIKLNDFAILHYDKNYFFNKTAVYIYDENLIVRFCSTNTSLNDMWFEIKDYKEQSYTKIMQDFFSNYQIEGRNIEDLILEFYKQIDLGFTQKINMTNCNEGNINMECENELEQDI